MSTSEPTSRSLLKGVVEYNLRKQHLPVPCSIISHEDSSQQPSFTLLQSVHHLCEEVVVAHAAGFEQVFKILPLTPDKLQSCLESVLSEMFSDEVYNWGRIVTLFAFCMKLTEECVKKEIPHLVPKVTDWTSEFITTHMQTWIDDHKGWEGLVEFVNSPKKASELFSWRSVCGYAAGAVGIFTLAMVAASRG